MPPWAVQPGKAAEKLKELTAVDSHQGLWNVVIPSPNLAIGALLLRLEVFLCRGCSSLGCKCRTGAISCHQKGGQARNGPMNDTHLIRPADRWRLESSVLAWGSRALPFVRKLRSARTATTQNLNEVDPRLTSCGFEHQGCFSFGTLTDCAFYFRQIVIQYPIKDQPITSMSRAVVYNLCSNQKFHPIVLPSISKSSQILLKNAILSLHLIICLQMKGDAQMPFDFNVFIYCRPVCTDKH